MTDIPDPDPVQSPNVTERDVPDGVGGFTVLALVFGMPLTSVLSHLLGYSMWLGVLVPIVTLTVEVLFVWWLTKTGPHQEELLTDGGTNEHSHDEDHEMIAEAFVPTRVKLDENGMHATQQLDFDVEKWVCSCGKSWDDDNKHKAEEHLQNVRTKTNSHD